MFKFKFTIDKETCFVYWAQSLIKWSWYFEKENYEFYKSLGGELTSEENAALEKLAKILKEEGFNWLFKAYSEHVDGPWADIKKVLAKKFEFAWQEELPKLENWQSILKDYNFEKFDPYFKKTFIFFQTPYFSEEFEVKLLFSASQKFPTAHVKDGFEKLILLNISGLKPSELNRAIGTLLHETSHKIEYRSNSRDLIKDAYSRLIKPLNLDIKNYKWKYLLVESVLKSIFSHRSDSYIGRILWPEILKEDVIREDDLSRNKTNFEYLARVVASNIEPLTKNYLENQKPLDKNFAEKVAEEWIKILKS